MIQIKKRVAIISTGGTIAGITHTWYTHLMGVVQGAYEPELKGQELLNKFPNLESIADIELNEIGVIDSMNATPEDWQKISAAIVPYLRRDDIDGIVVTHGTDTMSWSLMAASLVAQNPNKPIVFTGAMVPTDQNYDHVNRNITDAVFAAANSGINEVLLCFVGDESNLSTSLYRGSRALKQHPQKYAAFESFREDPVATVVGGEVIQNPNLPPTIYTPDRQLVIGANEYAGISPLYILNGAHRGVEMAIEDDLCILLQGPGRGSVGNYKSLADSVKRAIDKDLIVAVCSVDPQDAKLCVTPTDRELLEYGAIPLGDIHPQKAMVKLAWVAAQYDGDQALAKEMMQKDYARELTPGSHEPKDELDFIPN